jgi:tyrosyl-tRNA synthetase
MDTQSRVSLCHRLPATEILTEENLFALFESKDKPLGFAGFEPRGFAHLGSGLVSLLKVKDLVEAGCEFQFFLADVHATIRRESETLEQARKIGNYFKEAWAWIGLDFTKVRFRFASEEYDFGFLWNMINVCRHIKVGESLRALRIAAIPREIIEARKESLRMSTALYVPMQIADAFHASADIVLGAITQRAASVLMRNVGPRIGYTHGHEGKPICIHHGALPSFRGASKMGRSVSSSILVHDEPSDIHRKIAKAYCPPKQTENNPITEICRLILLRDERSTLMVPRPIAYGGEVTYYKYHELETDYRNGRLHPSDLKNVVAQKLVEFLEPCRRHFQEYEALFSLWEAWQAETQAFRKS